MQNCSTTLSEKAPRSSRQILQISLLTDYPVVFDARMINSRFSYRAAVHRQFDEVAILVDQIENGRLAADLLEGFSLIRCSVNEESHIATNPNVECGTLFERC